MYKKLVSFGFIDSLSLIDNRKDLATMISGFAYTMLGFMAAIVTILFAFTNTDTFQRYRRGGYLHQFFSMYVVTSLSLVFTAVVALASYSPKVFQTYFIVMMCSFSNNLIQVVIVTLVICKLAIRAFHESSRA